MENREHSHPPLTLAEKNLKNYYYQHPERHLQRPSRWDEVCDLAIRSFALDPDMPKLPLPLNNIIMTLDISTSQFIDEEMDVFMIRHARYLPAFWHKHDAIEIMYVMSGQCRNVFKNHEEVLQAGDLCIFPPDFAHAISTFHDDDLVMNILIRPGLFESLFMELVGEDTILGNFYQRIFHASTDIPYLLFHTGGDDRIATDILRAYEDYHSDARFRRQMVNAILHEVIITLVEKYESTLEIPALPVDDKATSLIYILRYMQSNFHHVALREMADQFEYSERQLQRIIYAATGMTFSQNVQQQKMNEAARLLRSTDLPITKVGEQVGYASPNNFRKIFYNHYQLTPSEYRDGKSRRLVSFTSYSERR